MLAALHYLSVRNIAVSLNPDFGLKPTDKKGAYNS